MATEKCGRCGGRCFECDTHHNPRHAGTHGCDDHECKANRRYCSACRRFPAVDPKTHCSDCGQHWDEHDFGVPKPYCPQVSGESTQEAAR